MAAAYATLPMANRTSAVRAAAPVSGITRYLCRMDHQNSVAKASDMPRKTPW
jgi:hypothetical protein